MLKKRRSVKCTSVSFRALSYLFLCLEQLLVGQLYFRKKSLFCERAANLTPLSSLVFGPFFLLLPSLLLLSFDN